MIPAQPILVLALLSVALLYFVRVRSSALVGLVVVAAVASAAVFVIDPDLATRLAHAVGVGRGADLLLYLSVPALAFMVVALYGRYRELHVRLTAVIREEALARAKRPAAFTEAPKHP